MTRAYIHDLCYLNQFLDKESDITDSKNEHSLHNIPNYDDISDNEHDEKDNNIKSPFYPTIDGRPPPNVSQEKPQQKPIKDDKKSQNTSNRPEENESNPFGGVSNNIPPQVHPPAPGPGYFNPQTIKTPYGQHPFINSGNIPPELYNGLGNPNLPSQTRFEHILQQIQGGVGPHEINQAGQNYNNPYQIQHQNGVNYPFHGGLDGSENGDPWQNPQQHHPALAPNGLSRPVQGYSSFIHYILFGFKVMDA